MPETQEQAGEICGLAPFQLRRATAYIHECVAQNLTLDRMAASAGLSVFHFARLFKQSTGLTPYQYVLHLRIKCAKSLLAETDFPICRVTAEVGFCDQSQFAKQFKRITGTTPMAYRRAAR